MNDQSIYVTRSGLRVYYVEKKDFHKSYAGIGVAYGSRDLKFYIDGQLHTSKEGLAHFIEHKLFSMPYGDAFAEFSKKNANANAYTDLDKTIYYFTTTADLFEPLKLLLEMYFTPHFIDDEVQIEKDIITSEIKLYDDVPQQVFVRKVLKALYPNRDISKNIAGTVCSVRNTTTEELKAAYDAFYTTDNSVLVIVSNQPRNRVYESIENIMDALPFQRGLPKLPKAQPFKKVGKDFVYQAKVEQTTAALALRFNVNYDVPMFCNFMIGILDSLLSPSASFYKELQKMNAFTTDIDYYVSTLRDTGYAIIQTNTNQPTLFLNLLEAKLKSFNKSDLNPSITELYLKHLKAKSIFALDSVKELGEEILVLALEGQSYLDELMKNQNLKIDNFYPFISYLGSAKYIKAICEKSTNKKKKENI